MPRAPRRRAANSAPQTGSYQHKHESPLRPDVGAQVEFTQANKPRAPQTFRYDSSLSPALDWDGQNAAREQGEALIREILDAKNLDVAKAAAAKLKALGRPFLNWAGKAERLSVDVPTLPLFVHERLSTKAIIETLKGHKRDKQLTLLDLFGDPQHSIADQVLRAYEHKDEWRNRMILGDSLVAMNSLLRYENLGGQVQMIYMDPPYGIKYGSNFQPFVRKREVSHNDDDDMTREPEMVQAYRDTWEIGLHSYLTHLRDRFSVCRELLHSSGSIFVQISVENLHHVREVMDEVFGSENQVVVIPFAKTAGQADKYIASVCDFLIWYARDINHLKYRQLYGAKIPGQQGASKYEYIELTDGTRRRMTADEQADPATLPSGSRVFSVDPLTSQEYRPDTTVAFSFEGQSYHPGEQAHWKTSVAGLTRLADSKRLLPQGNKLRYLRYLDDFPVFPLTNLWPDIGGVQSRTDPKIYVVQTSTTAIQRCLLILL